MTIRRSTIFVVCLVLSAVFLLLRNFQLSLTINKSYYVSNEELELPRDGGNRTKPLHFGIQPESLKHSIEDDARLASSALPLRDTDTSDRTCKQKSITAYLNSDPGEVNSFRRRLAMEDPICYEQSFSLLARHFINRLSTVKPHLHLHIPKTGGTSLCSLARLHKNTTNVALHDNCWQPKIFYPVWCCYAFEERKGLLDDDNATCDVFSENNPLPEFVMNENYLDYPLCSTHRIYSVALRNPIERAMSHESHLVRIRFRNTMPNSTFNKRAELGKNNYMTWALSSGANKTANKLSLVPQRDHLDIAKETLLRFDFLLELSRDLACDDVILNLMGFNSSALGRENEKHHRNYMADNLKPYGHYQEWNSLDQELYIYAQKLMDIDCDFFAQLQSLLETNSSNGTIAVVEK